MTRHSKAASYVIGRRYRERQTRRWLPEEDAVIDEAVRAGLTLDETHALLPNRTRDSVRDRYYRAREPYHDTPAALSDAQRQKDAREGSAKLYRALVDAGFVVQPRKVG